MKRRHLAILTAALAIALPQAARAQTPSQTTPSPTSCMPYLTSVAPPAGFDPLTATAAQLACYGFPRRPTNPTELAFWKHIVSLANHYVAPVFGKPEPPHTPNNDVFSSSFSGFDAPSNQQGGLNPAWNESSAEWNIPTTSSCSQVGDFVAPWDGIGGIANNPSVSLLQAGTNSLECGGGYQVWIEFYINEYPYNSPGELGTDNKCDNVNDPERNLDECTKPITSVTVYAGDEIYIDTDYTGGNSATFYIQDLTPGHSFYLPVAISPQDTVTHADLLSEYVDETDDECVVEQNAAPSQYSEVNVSNCFYTGSDSEGYDYAYNGDDYTVCINEGNPENVQDYLETYQYLDESINGFHSYSQHIRTQYNGCLQ